MDAGANRLRIVDTLGCITPAATHFLIKEIKNARLL